MFGARHYLQRDAAAHGEATESNFLRWKAVPRHGVVDERFELRHGGEDRGRRLGIARLHAPVAIEPDAGLGATPQRVRPGRRRGELEDDALGAEAGEGVGGRDSLYVGGDLLGSECRITRRGLVSGGRRGTNETYPSTRVARTMAEDHAVFRLWHRQRCHLLRDERQERQKEGANGGLGQKGRLVGSQQVA